MTPSSAAPAIDSLSEGKPASVTTASIWRDGLWRNNPGLVQLLGLCPLLAVTHSATNGLGLAIATLFVLVGSNALVSLIRPWLDNALRIPIFVIIIASLVTAIELLLKAGLPELSASLGIFIPLIVTNCTLLARAEAFASRQPLAASIQDGLAQGLGFGLVLITLGGLRELLSRGSVWADAERLLGDWAQLLTWQLFDGNVGLLLIALPPGAFIVLGLMVAAHQHLTRPVRDNTTKTTA